MKPCGRVGDYDSQIVIPMPPWWASSREHRTFCVDACIASEVIKLVYVHGVRTINSCCGHGELGASVIVAEEHIGVMQGLGYQPHEKMLDRPDIFAIPDVRVKHIGPNTGAGFENHLGK